VWTLTTKVIQVLTLEGAKVLKLELKNIRYNDGSDVD